MLAKNVRNIAILAALLLATAASRSDAVSFVGFGGGYTSSIADLTIDYIGDGTRLDTLSVGSGFSGEAQFAWEINPFVDMEGALRYHEFGISVPPVDSLSQPNGMRLVGFEGGIRLHTQRGFTNSCPYIRAGVGSYSPSIQFDNSRYDISTSTVLGYYIGAGYMHEFTSKIGADIRVTMVQYKAFSIPLDGVKLDSRFLSVALSLIIF